VCIQGTQLRLMMASISCPYAVPNISARSAHVFLTVTNAAYTHPQMFQVSTYDG
jgi:hypothetical protein